MEVKSGDYFASNYGTQSYTFSGHRYSKPEFFLSTFIEKKRDKFYFHNFKFYVMFCVKETRIYI